MTRIDHDGSLRSVFSHPRAFRDFIEGFVDVDNVLQLDWTTMKQVATRHSDESFKQIENDMIWEVGALGDPQRVRYLMVEFQSQPDRTMALRMWNYFGQLHSTLAKREDRQQGDKLPWVLPIVLYNAEREWKEAREFAKLVEGAPPGWEGPGPQFRHELVEVFRGPVLDRSRLNVADALFRLHRVESLDEARGEVQWLKQWLSGEKWQSLRRAMIAWIIKVLVPWRLPRVSVADVRDLTEWDELEAAMTTWSEKLKAEGHAEALVSIARRRFGEAVASTMSALLGSVRTEEALDEVGGWLVTCETGDALLAKIRQM